MAKIDSILGGMAKYGARSAIVQSGTPIMFRFPTGDRYAQQKSPHQEVVSLVSEIADENVEAALLIGGTATFEYVYQGKAYTISVVPKENLWKVTIENGSGNGQTRRTSIPVQPQDIRSPTPDRLKKPRRNGTNGKYIDNLLVEMIERGASDLHLCTGTKPRIRADGSIQTFGNFETMNSNDLFEKLTEVIPKENLDEFEQRNDTDFAYEIKGLSRFRFNVFRDRLGPGAVVRAIPFEILTPEQLGLPQEVLRLCHLTKGLVLVTGPTGSGKSTTLATLIDYINSHREDHIITIEDPIEFVHENKKCLVNQREIYTHTDSFKNALRAALREDPDIVLVGEMRDLETISIAVETAETGHLVFGTLHTTTAPSTIDRIIDQFPADRQEQIRTMVAESLRGVIAQNLCKKKPKGRVAAFEVLIGSPAVSNLIREHKTFQLASVMQTGRARGMVTLEDSLLSLVNDDLVEPYEAFLKAPDKESFKRILSNKGYKLPEGVE